MALIPWVPPSSASLITVVSSSVPILAPAQVNFKTFSFPSKTQKKKLLIVLLFLSWVFVGIYVANRASDKITQLTDNVYLCRSGSVCGSLSFC